MNERPLYPFTAIVGQERMKLALLLNAVHPALGGVLIRGEKGTAKSTAVRALASLLPELTVVQGCPYGCAPDDAEPCAACAAACAAGGPLATVRHRAPLVELPIGATEDRVLGSLDLEAAIGSGERRFEPGLLARANRGVLYVDEVNLLGDHLVDILLDAAAMGRNYVEREAVSVSHPARFLLVGTMNPEEGELRPQLLDRFALAVEVGGALPAAERAEAVRRRIAFEADPVGFVAAWREREADERERIERARALLPAVTLSDSLLTVIGQVCADLGVDGLRADLAIYRAAVAHAAYHGRAEATVEDVRVAAELALPHRQRRRPFEQPTLDQQQLAEALAKAAASAEASQPQSAEQAQAHDDEHDQSDGSPAEPPTRPEGPSDSAIPPDHRQDAPAPDGRVAAPGAPYSTPSLLTTRPRPRAQGGRHRGGGREERGPAVRTRQSVGRPREWALAATVRAAAPHQRDRRARCPSGPMLRLTRGDLRERVRAGRSRALIVFAVDASGSMGARQRMTAAKTAVLSLLLDAYRRRDRVALVTFRGHEATIALPPTNSLERAERLLRDLPAGGRTPLAAGLTRAREVIERQERAGPLRPLLVLVSDVRPTSGAQPWPEALAAAEPIRAAGWEAVVLDTERGRQAVGLGAALAEALGGRRLAISDLEAGTIERAVRAAAPAR